MATVNNLWSHQSPSQDEAMKETAECIMYPKDSGDATAADATADSVDTTVVRNDVILLQQCFPPLSWGDH